MSGLKNGGPSRLWLAVVSLIAITAVVPPLLHWLMLRQVALLSAAQARQALAEPGSVLVDVRKTEEYRESHIAGAISWPYKEVVAHPAEVPEVLRGQRLYLICTSGIISARAARVLSRQSPSQRVAVVEGGIEGWNSSSAGCCGARPATGTAAEFRESPRLEQWLAVITGFVIKPAYMVLSLVLIIILWRRRETDLRSLRWSMIFFLFGETFCAINYLFFHDTSALSEYLHSYGMPVAFAFAAFSLMEALDERCVHFADVQKRCALLEVCGPCVKYSDVSCGLRRLMLFGLPCLAVVALMPLTTDPRIVSYDTRILGTLYNYSHPVIHQLFEIRYCPVLGCLFLVAAWLTLLLADRGGLLAAKILSASGLGAAGFGWFRFILFHAYQRSLVWFSSWEEFTEMMFVAGTAWLLWVFRERLFTRTASSQPELVKYDTLHGRAENRRVELTSL